MYDFLRWRGVLFVETSLLYYLMYSAALEEYDLLPPSIAPIGSNPIIPRFDLAKEMLFRN